ncbi:hypothetical protein [Amycolatopsis sp. CA-230715]|uniref:hypothetical protein n=1 Tax=Amycolatopsis sp. CA-230715 TaxID=2745196 RepID=UPI001C034156|nr:hypothetical protein [Amycolatopsis sp. CA-230715]QWF85604.1 hypothetical protein HUW46_09059 [Amycolatopsis sp. CA-230715]
MTDTVLPDLWLDWCAVTETPVDRRDETTLDLFARQAGPSLTVLDALRPMPVGTAASAWPSALRDDDTALWRLVRGGSVRIADPAIQWITRLRLRRLLFAAVLLAPAGHGGLGLTRGQARRLTPSRLRDLRPRIGRTDDEASCPACAVWSWLEVIGTNNDWSQRAVRELGHRRDQATDASHRHERNDPSPGWFNWPNHPNLLPAIDQWGYIDLYGSMHPSSLSALIPAMETLVVAPVAPSRGVDREAAGEPQRITPEEEAAIFARADELNARVARILAEYG